MEIEDLGPAERFAAGAVGPPGNRRFFFEVTANGVRHSVGAEKEQVAALAIRAMQLLERTSITPDAEAVARLIAEGLEIAEPETERFQVGNLAVAVTSTDFLTLTLESNDGEKALSFAIAPEQLQAAATVALEVVASGRPLCPWCRLPMDPEDHRCPAANGHHAS